MPAISVRFAAIGLPLSRPGRWVAGAAICLALLAGAGMSPAPALAASCCGGASATDPFVLPKWNDGMAGASLVVSSEFDQRGPEGERLHLGSYRATEARLTVGGAYRLHRDVQAAVSVPFVQRNVAAGGPTHRGAGIGDPTVGARYEFLDEETCFARPFSELSWDQLKPSVHGFVRTTLPAGRSTAASADALGADVTGRGYWVAEAGVDLTKVWGVIGNSFQAGAGYQWPKHEGSGQARAVRLAASASLLYYPAYQRFVGLSVSHRQERWQGDRAGERRSTTDAGVIGSYVLDGADWWLRGSLMTTGLLQGEASFVGVSGGLTVVRLF